MNSEVSVPKISILLATYNMPFHLEMVLTALEKQTFSNFEILLCDDGSGPNSYSIAKKFYTKLNITHLWQENLGFRKCRLLNEGLRRSRGELCIFLDADCIPHRDFVLDHWATKSIGTYGAGRRVELSRKISANLTVRDIEAGLFNFPTLRLIWDQLTGETKNWNRTIRWGANPVLRRILKLDQITDLKGCNFSAFRTDLFTLNGFDEAYEGYGREDTDLEIRMNHLGLKIRSLKGLALQFHVWHERRGFTSSNDELLESVKNSKKIQCELGINGGNALGIKVLN